MAINGISGSTGNGHLDEEDINQVVDKLSDPSSYAAVYHTTKHDFPMPSVAVLRDVVELLKSVIFPGYFVHSEVRPHTMKYYIGSTLDQVYSMLSEQIKRGYCFSCPTKTDGVCEDCESMARAGTRQFLLTIPTIRRRLSLDAAAAFDGDPAAQGIGETIFCYPSIAALTNHRISHELYRIGVPLIPRIISEMAHSDTGIDIHPGATIGDSFFIDHGTGTVIGETTIIGANVRIYQGVTLGARSFPLDGQGKPLKGIPRHPIVEDSVVIYSGATILGRVCIGRGAEIGGNVWVTRDIPAGARVMQGRAEETYHNEGSGI